MNNHGERGVALMTVLVLVCVVGMITTLAQARSLRLATDSLLEKGEAEALYAAEGGLAMARHTLRSDPDWPGAQLEVGDCQVLVTVDRISDEQWSAQARAIAWPAGDRGNPVQVTLAEDLGERYRYRSPRR